MIRRNARGRCTLRSGLLVQGCGLVAWCWQCGYLSSMPFKHNARRRRRISHARYRVTKWCGRAFAALVPRVLASTGPVHVVLDSKDEWNIEKHGSRGRHWHKLHLAVDADTGEVAAHLLTERDGDDAAAQVPSLLEQAESAIASWAAESAYDAECIYAATRLRQRHPLPDVVVPYQASAVPSSDEGGSTATARVTTTSCSWPSTVAWGSRR